jgi:hypothetical protein
MRAHSKNNTDRFIRDPAAASGTSSLTLVKEALYFVWWRLSGDGVVAKVGIQMAPDAYQTLVIVTDSNTILD